MPEAAQSSKVKMISVDTLTEHDWPSVRRIYEEGIATGDATFETSAPNWPEWDAAHLRSPRLVARGEDQVLGWAALSPVSRRQVYAGVAEVSVYVAAEARGQKIGQRLLRALVEASEQSGIWTLQAGIFPENIASLAMHKACGFTSVGKRKRIGRMDGRWRDTILMERRSDIVGLE
ncbi:MAG TPA: GNAT family N-acetyltransferase [Terriglobales bacterium]|nr:GNAT family N-acetyltransferase [Terriglobales bacterium]